MDEQLLEGFEHARTIADDIAYLQKNGRDRMHRMTGNFEQLLELALKVVSTSYGEQEQAIEELESFLR